MSGIKGRTYPPEPLSAVEVRKLLAARGDETLAAARDYALMVVLWRTGLRISELLALRISDFDPVRGTVRVLHGKGNKARTVGIDDGALEVVETWIQRRAVLRLPDDAPLFCTLHRRPYGRPIAPRQVRAMMTRLGADAGIGHRVHPHGLRHTHAVELVHEGWPVPLIARQLGHSNVATTDTYLAHLFPGEVVDRARGRSWSTGAA